MLNSSFALIGHAPSLHAAPALAFFQTTGAVASGSISSGDDKLLIILGLVAAAMVVQAIVFVILAVVGINTQKKLLLSINELKAKALPIMDKSTGLMTDLSPEIKAITLKVRELFTDLAPQIKELTVKVNAISGHIEHISGLAKDQAVSFAPAVTAAQKTFIDATNTVQNANLKTRAQVERVNGMVSSVLDATTKLGNTVHYSIQVPTREIAGIVTGVKTAIDVLFSGARTYGNSPRPARPFTGAPSHYAQSGNSLTRTDADAALLHEQREAGF